jgi:hypothetical protein
MRLPHAPTAVPCVASLATGRPPLHTGPRAQEPPFGRPSRRDLGPFEASSEHPSDRRPHRPGPLPTPATCRECRGRRRRPAGSGANGDHRSRDPGPGPTCRVFGDRRQRPAGSVANGDHRHAESGANGDRRSPDRKRDRSRDPGPGPTCRVFSDRRQRPAGSGANGDHRHAGSVANGDHRSRERSRDPQPRLTWRERRNRRRPEPWPWGGESHAPSRLELGCSLRRGGQSS